MPCNNVTQAFVPQRTSARAKIHIPRPTAQQDKFKVIEQYGASCCGFRRRAAEKQARVHHKSGAAALFVKAKRWTEPERQVPPQPGGNPRPARSHLGALRSLQGKDPSGKLEQKKPDLPSNAYSTNSVRSSSRKGARSNQRTWEGVLGCCKHTQKRAMPNKNQGGGSVRGEGGNVLVARVSAL